MALSDKKVVVAGHICIDLTPIFPENCKGDVAKILIPGKLIHLDGINIHTGGVVANTGFGMKILGADVHLMGKIGNDELGDTVQTISKSHGIEDPMIITEKSSTSYTVAIAIPGQDRIFLHSPGANDTFAFEDLDMDEINKATLFHFGYPPLMKSMFEEDGRELTKIFKNVFEAGVVTSLDMAGVDAMSPAGKADWGKILEHTLPYVDIFVPSVEELLYMMDREKLEHLMEEADGRELTLVLDMERDVKPLGERLIRMGAKIVLIKCGAPGICYRTASKDRLAEVEKKLGFSLTGWENREGFEKSYVPERVLSATGAGDTSIAAFLASLLNEEPLETCMEYATATGACCVAAYDALSGLKSFSELRRKINDGWAKQEF